MWRSKLYVDVRIHLKPQSPEDDLDQELEDDSDSSTDSLSSTAVFTSHRFILCSRSPYFASVLLNPAFKPQATADIHLPTPPFTPAALHFCLGYMYAGHLDFSNRSFDLTTGFAIYRAAMYLQLEALVQEIESRIVHDFSHGLDVSKCKCRRCPLRAARVWRFASEPDVGAVQLRDQARRYVIRAWGQSWGREIGLMEKEDKAQLVRDVCSTVTPNTVVGAMKSIKAVRVRIESGIRAKGRDAALWADSLGDMVDQVETHVRTILANSFQQVADSTELWDLLSGKGFDGDVLDNFVNEVVASVATAKGCTEAPRLYQVSRNRQTKPLQVIFFTHCPDSCVVDTAQGGPYHPRSGPTAPNTSSTADRSRQRRHAGTHSTSVDADPRCRRISRSRALGLERDQRW